MSALDLLTGDAQTFLSKVWASQVQLHRADPESLTGLLSLDDADQLLTSTAIRTPGIRMAQDGRVLPESAYTRSATIAGKALTGLVDARKALALFDGGASIVFQGLHRYHPPLTRLIAELELELGHPCQANAYLTPPGSQGFAVHHDSHDVFVFQTAGSKVWEIHQPARGEAAGGFDGSGETGVDEVVMEPGLAMYLPAGTPHAARAQQSASLHVTIGINQLTWRGLVERSLAPLLAEVPSTHLPAGFIDDPARLAEPLAERLEALAEAVRRVDAATAVEAEIKRFLTSRPPRLAGGLRDVLGLDAISLTTPLRRRPGHPCVLLERGDLVEVLLGDRSISGPAKIKAAVEEIRARGSLTPADLPLDPQSNLVLCRRLVREGLLELA